MPWTARWKLYRKQSVIISDSDRVASLATRRRMHLTDKSVCYRLNSTSEEKEKWTSSENRRWWSLTGGP